MRHSAYAPLAALLAFSLAAPTRAVVAQQSTPPAAASRTVLPIVPGARVKVSATTLVAPLLANYLEMKGDTAVFIESSAGRGIWTFTLDQITRIEQSQGDKKYNKGPMIKGAAIGAPIGALLFWGTTGIVNTSDSTRTFNRGATAGFGAAVGAVVGAIVGSRIPQEHWLPLPLPKKVSFNPFRKDGAMELRIGYTF